MYSNTTLSHLKNWTKGAFLSSTNENLKVTSISSDSRSLKRGEVFIALRGENFDGHKFLKKVAEMGALAVISEEKVDLSCPVLLVDNTLQAYVRIGQGLRSRFSGPVYAVTGSAGKSSTRDMIHTLLGPNTLRAPASFNNLLGVSKTLCLLEDSHEKLVLEMGMNARGEIKEMCEAFAPNLGLITNIGDAHIGKLGGQEGVYFAKKELFDYLTTQSETLGLAINADDPLVLKAFYDTGSKGIKHLTYSANGLEADVKIINKSMDPKTCYLNLEVEIEGRTHSFSCGIFGLHHAENIVAAIAAARLIDTPIEAILSRLKDIRPADHRGHILQLPNQITVIDESYNSNPAALKSSLTSLKNISPARTRFVVIGEMKELGEFSEKLHRECGQFLVESHEKLPFRLLTVGEGAKALSNEAKKKGIEPHHVANYSEALEWVQKQIFPGAVLFVKGSHGVRLDLLVDSLTQSVKN